jgi:predicted glycosyltransferase
VGLGNMRRQMLIAGALIASPLRPRILLIAGARQANAFTLPEGIDCVTLPALHKIGDGQYRSRDLHVSTRRIMAIRAGATRAAIAAFHPDVLVVDQMPHGVNGELDPTLDYLRVRHSARCVLGLRDILDEPDIVAREWQRTRTLAAIREHYDAVWVYGDPHFYDVVREYRLPADVAQRVRYTGYFDRRGAAVPGTGRDAPSLGSTHAGRTVVCTVGGGHDGARLADAFTHARFPPDTTGVLVLGPFMPARARERLRRRAARKSNLRVLDFLPDPLPLMAAADRVITMGGYNTVSEILSLGVRALVVPRVAPRREQLMRAERLRDLGLIDMALPETVDAAAIGAWIARDLQSPPRAGDRLDLDGLSRLPGLLAEVLNARGLTEARAS